MQDATVHVDAPDPDHPQRCDCSVHTSQLYMIFLPYGVTLPPPPTPDEGTLGYHNHFSFNGNDIRYAGWSAETVLDIAVQTTTATHELAEAFSSPTRTSMRWLKDCGNTNPQEEIGEDGDADQYAGVFDGYSVQFEWSNAANRPFLPSNVTGWSTANGWVSQIVTIVERGGTIQTLGIGMATTRSTRKFPAAGVTWAAGSARSP